MNYSNIIVFPYSKTINSMALMTNESINEQVSSTVVKETAMSFSKKVEDLVWDKDISYIDALQELVETEDLEADQIGKLLTKELYIKIEHEAEKLSLVKTDKVNRLF